MAGERVVLARRSRSAFQPYQWTGAEPEGLDDADVAVQLGARWEGDELVTYDFPGLAHGVAQHDEPFMSDYD